MSEGLRVKICGLMTEADCKIINRHRPDLAGFVFANTRHRVTDDEAAGLRKMLDPAVDAVGVFVDEPVEHVISLVKAGTIQMVQLHGSEDDDYIAKLKSLSCPIIRAARVKDGTEIERAAAQDADYLLLDTWDRQTPGGSGRRFDKKHITGAVNKPWFLAGGLTPDNIAEVLKETKEAALNVGIRPPFALDVSSGVESEAAGGHKDEALVAGFIDFCRNCGKV